MQRVLFQTGNQPSQHAVPMVAQALSMASTIQMVQQSTASANNKTFPVMGTQLVTVNQQSIPAVSIATTPITLSSTALPQLGVTTQVPLPHTQTQR